MALLGFPVQMCIQSKLFRLDSYNFQVYADVQSFSFSKRSGVESWPTARDNRQLSFSSTCADVEDGRYAA